MAELGRPTEISPMRFRKITSESGRGLAVAYRCRMIAMGPVSDREKLALLVPQKVVNGLWAAEVDRVLESFSVPTEM